MHFFIDDCIGHGIVSLDGGRRLFVTHFFKNDSDVDCLMGMIYRVANFASIVENITCFMTCTMFKMAPLLSDSFSSKRRKKWLPVQLRAWGSLR